MTANKKVRKDREGTIFERVENGRFKGFRAVLPIYDPITDKLIQRVYGNGMTAELAIKRRNAKAYELLRQLGQTITPQAREKLNEGLRPSLQAEAMTLAEYTH